jgi:lipopolysaccharide export system permease protein
VRLIIQRYLMREIAVTFLGVSLLLALMLLSSNFIRLATETLEGDYPVAAFLTLFALKGVGNIVFILPFAFFIAVLLTLSRLYKDNEIIVLMACGVGPGRLLSSVATLGLAVTLLVGYMALFFAPWAAELSKQLLDEAGAQQGIEGIVAGRFNSLGSDSPTIYVERYEADKKLLHGIFVQGFSSEAEGHKLYVIKAARAQERKGPQGNRYLVLQDGYRYEGTQGKSDYRVIQFAEHGIRLVEREVTASRRPNYAIPTSRLWGDESASYVAEFQWRLSVPISTLLLALIAVPLSKSTPRSGYYRGLFLGILVYVIYNNLLTVGRSLLTKGDVPLQVGLWWVHLLVLVLLVVILWHQRGRRSVRSSRAGS